MADKNEKVCCWHARRWGIILVVFVVIAMISIPKTATERGGCLYLGRSHVRRRRGISIKLKTMRKYDDYVLGGRSLVKIATYHRSPDEDGRCWWNLGKVDLVKTYFPDSFVPKTFSYSMFTLPRCLAPLFLQSLEVPSLICRPQFVKSIMTSISPSHS